MSGSLPSVFSEGYSAGGGVMGVQVGPLRVSQRDLLTVDPSGHSRRVFQRGLFGFVDTNGVVQPIDTTIKGLATGFSPDAVGYAARIGGNARAGVSWSDSLADRPVVRLIPLEANRSKFEKVPSQPDTVVAPSAWPSSDLYYVALGHGLKEHIVVRDWNAPTSYRFRVERPLKAKSRIVDGGGVSVDLRGSGTIALFPAPEGQSANGVDVPMWFTLKRFRRFDEITLHYDAGVQMTGGDWARPALPLDLDPAIGTYDLADSDNSVAQASQAGAFATYSQGVFSAGLEASPTTPYPFNAYGQWVFTPPPGGASWYWMSGTVTGSLGDYQQYFVYDGLGDRLRVSRNPPVHPELFASATSHSFSATIGINPDSFIADNVHTTAATVTSARWYADLSNVVRTFSDNENPVVTSLDPQEIADGLLPETFAASMTFTDGQSGCGTAKLAIVTRDYQPVTEQTAAGCGIATSFTLAPGKYWIIGTGIDAAGNQAGVPHAIEIASATPQLDLDHPLDGELFDQTVPVTGFSTALGLSNYEVTSDGLHVKWLTATRSFNDTVDLSFVPEGVRHLSVTVNTLSGLTATQTRLITIDHNPPSLAIDEPVNGGVVGGFDKQFRATASDNVTAVAVTFAIDGQDKAFDQSPPFSFTYDSRALSNGPHTFTARAVDQLGHTTTRTNTVVVDNLDPTAAILQPADGAELSGPTTIKVSGGDNNAVASMDVSMTNERGYIIPLGTVTHGGTQDFAIDTNSVQNGPFVLSLIVTDLAANTKIVQYHVTVNNQQFTTGIEDSLSRTTGPMDLVVTHDTGNLHIDSSDTSTRALGLPLSATRSYNHQDPTGGSFGPGWRASFDQQLVLGLDDVATWIDADGSKHRFIQLANGSFTKPYGLDATLAETGTGWDLTEKDGLTHEFAPDGTFLGDRARTGQHITLHRNASGVLQSISDDSGLALTVTVNGSGRVSEIRDPLNRATSYSYDGSGRLASVTDPAGASTAYAYDAQNRLVSVTDALARQSTVVYGPSGKVASMTDPAGTPFTIVYGSATETIGGVQTYFNFNSNGFLTLKRRADGSEIHQTYDARGNLKTSTDANGRTTQYDYDAADNLTVTTNPDNSTTSRSNFDAFGQPHTTVDEFGKQTLNQYDTAGNLTRQQKPGGSVTTYTYDAAGSALTETDPNHGHSSYSYDAHGNLTSETNALGHATSYQVDAAGQTLKQTDAAGNETTYTHDAAGRQTSETDPRGFTSTTTYDAVGRIVAQTDRAGHATTMAYNAAGDMTSSTDPTGLATNYTYTPFGEVATQTDPAGATTEFRYDAVGDRVKVIDPLGGETTFQHDPAGNVTAKTDPLGHTTRYEYDLNNQPTMVTDPNGAITRTSYRSDGTVASTTDAAGAVTTYDYTDQGDVAHTTSPAGGITATGYDAAGNPIASTDPLTYTSHTVYDSASQPKSVDDPLGASKLMDYSPIGTLTTQTDENNHATTLAYDAAGNLTAQTDPEGGVRATEYDPEGRVSAQVNELGARMSIARDAAGRATQVTDYAGKTWQLAYDHGRLATTTDPTGTVTTYSYDASGRVSEKATAGGDDETYTRDPLGRIESITDGQGHTTSYTRGLVGEIRTITNPDGDTTTYHHDAAGRLDNAIDPAGHATSYDYDSAGRLRSETSDVKGATTYAYNVRNDLASLTTSAGTTTFVHDANGRITSVERSDGTGETYVYDPAGNVTSRTDATGTTSYAWDGANRLAALTLPNGLTITYTRDLQGNVTAQSADSVTTGYLRDNAGRLTQLTTPAGTTGYTYTPTSRVKAVHYPGWDLALAWDANDRITGIDDTAAGNRRYVRDGSGRVITQTDPTGESTYAYSPAGRLDTWTAPGGLQNHYSYDAHGNITAVTRTWTSGDASDFVPPGNENLIETCLATNMQDCPNPQIRWAIEQFTAPVPSEDPTTWTGVRQHVANYFHAHPITTQVLTYTAGDHLASVSDPVHASRQDFTYDDRGNQITAAEQTRTFDTAGHLGRVATASGVIDYAYDAMGHLTTATMADGQTSYDRDERGRILRIATPGSGNARLAYDDYGPHSITTASGSYTYHYDQRGDVTVLTDATGQIAASYAYNSWGAHTSTGDPVLIALNPYTLDGQELVTWDAETGLYNMHHRWYDPQQMRFISPDPQPSQPNLADHPYAYAASDPINHTDPSGNLAWGVDARAQTAAIAQALQPFVPPPVTPIAPEPSLAVASSFVPQATQPDNSRYQNPREVPEYEGPELDTEQTGPRARPCDGITYSTFDPTCPTAVAGASAGFGVKWYCKPVYISDVKRVSPGSKFMKGDVKIDCDGTNPSADQAAVRTRIRRDRGLWKDATVVEKFTRFLVNENSEGIWEFVMKDKMDSVHNNTSGSGQKIECGKKYHMDVQMYAFGGVVIGNTKRGKPVTFHHDCD